MRKLLKQFYYRYKLRFRWLWPWIIGSRDLLRRLPLQMIPISSKFFGRPKGFHRTTHEFLTSPAGRAGRNVAHQIHPAETLRFNLPTPLGGGEVHPKFRENQVKEMPPTYVFELENARFWGHYGGSIISADDRLLGDVSHDVLGVERHKIFTKLKLPRCRRLPGTVAVLATAEAATNYWHWSFDLLPRFHLLAKAGFTPANVNFYLVNHTGLPFQLEMLTEFGIRPEQIIRSDARTHIEAERLVVSSLKPSQLHVTRWACDFLHGLVAGLESSNPPTRRLFISRENANFRRLLNEAEVFEIVRPLGFEKIHSERLSVREQQRLFFEAEMVLGPHGSGFTNLVYCRPQARMLEIFSAGYVDPALWSQSACTGLRHWTYIDDATASGRTRDPVLRHDDFTIDLDRFARALPSFLDLQEAR